MVAEDNNVSNADYINALTGTHLDTLTPETLDVLRNALIGTAGNDVLTNYAGIYLDRYIIGASGNDSLMGSVGNDTLYGGAGDDTLDGGGWYFDRLYGGDGNDLIKAAIGANFQVSGLVFANTVDGGAGNDTVNFYNNSASGTIIDLNAQTLTVNYDYNGTIYTYTTALVGIENVIMGGGSADSIRGSIAANSISGGIGNDTLFGLDGNDTLAGNSGTDSFNGGNGVDVVDYRDQTGNWNINLTTDKAVYGSTTETLTSIEGIFGSLGNDTITGDTTANQLLGHDGSDSILGDAGNDTLMGGLGRDTINGGAGNDVFLFTALAESQVAAPDSIVDFTHGVDKINVHGLGFAHLDTDGGITEAGELRFSAAGGITTVTSDQTGFIFQLGGNFTAATLTDSDFIW